MNFILLSLSSVIIITLIIIALKIVKRFQRLLVLNKIPGPKTRFLFGNALELMGGPIEFFDTLVTKFCVNPGGLTRAWIMHKPFVFIYGASGVEALLNNSRNIVKGSAYRLLHSWIGEGLLTSSETAMGRSINAQDDPQSDYVTAVHDMSRIFITRFSRPWLQNDFIFNMTKLGKLQKKSLNILHTFALDTIRERRKEYKQLKANIKDSEDEIIGKKKRQAFLDLLIEYLEEGCTLTEEDIREEVETFMFEGHDTSASGITWTVYLLGQHPEIQEKVYEELESIFGKSDRPATSEDIRQMNYLECCIKESLRLLPPVHAYVRELTDDLIIDGYVVPRGTDTCIFAYTLHRDSKHFPDPLKFQPERFFPEISAKRNPYAYVPFSAGPRNCIGQKFALLEMKVLLSTFLRNYKVESLETMKDLKLTGDIVLRPVKEMNVKIFSRN